MVTEHMDAIIMIAIHQGMIFAIIGHGMIRIGKAHGSEKATGNFVTLMF